MDGAEPSIRLIPWVYYSMIKVNSLNHVFSVLKFNFVLTSTQLRYFDVSAIPVR